MHFYSRLKKRIVVKKFFVLFFQKALLAMFEPLNVHCIRTLSIAKKYNKNEKKIYVISVM